MRNAFGIEHEISKDAGGVAGLADDAALAMFNTKRAANGSNTPTTAPQVPPKARTKIRANLQTLSGAQSGQGGAGGPALPGGADVSKRDGYVPANFDPDKVKSPEFHKKVTVPKIQREMADAKKGLLRAVQSGKIR